MNRRNFLQSSLGLSALATLSLNAQANPAAKRIGLQLYTLRGDIQKQGIETVLAQVAKLGYTQVENFGYGDGKFFGKSAAEYRKLLKDNGLSAVSGHYSTGRSQAMKAGTSLTKNWQQVIDDAAAIGQKYAIIAYLTPDERKPDDYKQLVDLLGQGAETAKKAGLAMGYHNHDFEFRERMDGQKPYDFLLKNTAVKMEMDLYWVVKAGERPSDYFSQYPGRFPLWHVKDMANSPEREFAEVGSGTIDFGGIFCQAKQAGLVQYFVEQDVCKRPPMESIGMSIDHIRKASWG